MNHAYFQYQIRHLGWRQNDEFFVGVIQSKKESVTAQDAANYLHMLQSVFSDIISDTIEGAFVFLVHMRKLSPVPDQKSDELKRIISNIHQKCGCSSRFNDIEELYSHYVQALSALHFADFESRDNSVVFYSDVLARHMAEHFAQSYNPMHFAHPDVRTLFQYDETHNSQLLQTLIVYLCYNKSHLSCCRHLNIHKSTLQYRLNKIKDLVGDACFAPENIMSILFSGTLISAAEPED